MKAVYLDTHVALLLYGGLKEKIPEVSINLIESNEIFISPIIPLEIQLLFEIGRINATPHEILDDLRTRINLNMDDISFEVATQKAIAINWTRDPFDRLIAACSSARAYPLITKDSIILKNHALSIWAEPKTFGKYL